MPKLVLMPYLHCVGNLCWYVESPYRTKSMFTLMSQKSLSKHLTSWGCVSPHTGHVDVPLRLHACGVHTFVSTCTHDVCLHSPLHLHMSTCACVRASASVRVRVHIYIYIYTCVCIHLCTKDLTKLYHVDVPRGKGISASGRVFVLGLSYGLGVMLWFTYIQLCLCVTYCGA